jgi:outer membrane protein assembly factor BamB
MALTMAAPAVANASGKPVNHVRPRISGRLGEGRVLTASRGAWTHAPSSFTYRWQRCTKAGRCSTIAHRTTHRYRIVRADENRRIRVVVTASDGARSKPARSKLTALVGKPSSTRSTTSSTTPSSSDDGTPATAYQLNAQHTGVSSDGFSTAATQVWSDNLGASTSYPLIVDGQVFVIAGDDSSPDPSLYALDANTGNVDWGPVQLGGSRPWADLTYDAGKVFIVNGSGTMEAFDAGTGTLDWATQLPTQWSFSAPPTGANGIVYTSGAGDGGTVYAVNEADGSLAWTQSVENGDTSSPAVSSGGVYVSYACGQSYDFDPNTGDLIWHRATACEGGGGKTPVLANGLLYVRDSSFPAVLDAGSGVLQSSFRSSGPAPAVTASMIYNLEDGTLSAAPATPGSSISWTFTGDGTLSSAPIVAGDEVIIAGTSGEVYGLSSSDGSVLWQASAGAAVPAPDEQNVSQPLTGLAESGGLLVVPAGDTLVAFR